MDEVSFPLRDLVEIDDELRLRVGPVTVQLTPRRAFDLVEEMVRKSTRRIVTEEAARASPRRPVKRIR